MLKSDDTSFYHSSSPSTESDSFSENNNKSIDTVSRLFSSLLKNPELSLNTEKPPSLVTYVPNDLQLTKSECAHNELPSYDTSINKSPLPKEKFDYNSTSSNPLPVNDVVDTSNDFQEKRLLATSSETVVIERTKCSSTPFNSKIPILYARSDPLSNYYDESTRKHQHNVGLKPINNSSLKQICSSSKIPVSTRRPQCGRVLREPSALFAENYYRRPPDVEKGPPRRHERGAPGRYTHVKSKLAAYINRPMKVECNKSSRSKSPCLERTQVKHDSTYPNFSGIKRISSRTSLDTYTCDYKVPLIELNCSDCAKYEDVTRNYQKAREHFELAMEHNKIKTENERIVTEHRRIITKHQQLMLEHEEKANEHTLKAIAHVLHRIT